MTRLAFLCLLALSLAPLRAAESPSDWTEESKKEDLTISSRKRDGSALKEFRGVGLIDAAPATVFAVLDDAESYPHFMPYTIECHILKRTRDFMIAYQRLDLPLVNDRDYTLRSEHSKSTGPDGPIYRIRWVPANDLGPAEKPGVQRVTLCEGGWLLEPNGAGGTRATYTIYTDSGGAVPAFIANNGSRIAITKLFAAVRKQAREPKYAARNAE